MAMLIGSAANQVPTNGDLGTMAFQDHRSVNIQGGAIAGAYFSLADYVDDAAAAAGGIAIGQLYRTGSTVKVRVA